MSNRIPPSLNWLVKKRARIHGELLKIKQQKVAYLKSYDRNIKKLELDLAALDRTLFLHEIKINPNIIPPIELRPINQTLKYGKLTSLIFESYSCFNESELTIREIMVFVADKANLDINNLVQKQTLYQSVRYRIKNLCCQGKLTRIGTGKGTRYQLVKKA